MPKDRHVEQSPQGGRYSPNLLFAGKKLRVSVRGPRTDKLMLTYDNWMREKKGFGQIKTSSRYADRGFTHLHLSTRSNDWFLTRETDAVLGVIEDFASGFDHAATIGFSMGGYGVLLAGLAVDFDLALLISPHVTFSEHQYPHETRYAARIGNLGRALKLNERIVGASPARARAAVVYDSAVAGDAYHAEIAGSRFRRSELVDLSGGGHPATMALTRAGHFPLVLDAITGAELDMGPLRRAHAACVT